MSRRAEVVVPSLWLQMKTLVGECGELHVDERVVLQLCECPCVDVVARRIVVTHVADDVRVGKDELRAGAGEQGGMLGCSSDGTLDAMTLMYAHKCEVLARISKWGVDITSGGHFTLAEVILTWTLASRGTSSAA